MLKKEHKSEIIKQFAKSKSDTGSCSVQIGILTERIKQVSEHLKKFPKDTHSKLGLVKMVGKRKTFFNYLKKTDKKTYDNLVKKF